MNLLAVGDEAPAKVCTACPLHDSAITNCMPGRGEIGAEIMIVAQGPGGKEDLAGEPLIGPSGKLLDRMLALAGYTTEKLYRTNATRCRAPSDRAPTTEEINACREHLKAEIHRVKPQAIIALGDPALRSLCKITGISKARGKEFPLHKDFEFSAPVFPTYHPAYVARSPMAERTVVADLRRVRDRHADPERIPWTWYGQAPLRIDGPIALDIETLKFGSLAQRKDVYTDHPVQIALASKHGVIVASEEDITQACMMLRRAPEIVTHNGWEFDIPKLQRYHADFLPLGRDTMVLAYLDDETQPLGLESLCVKYLGVPGWKEDKNAALGSDTFAEYNARDAYYTLQLYNVLVERLGARVRLADEIIGPALQALRACSARGIYIAQGVVARSELEVSHFVSAAREELRGLTANSAFNPNAARQVGAFIESFGVTLPRTPKSGEYKVDKEVIEGLTLPALQPFKKALLDYRTANKTLSTYIEPYKAVAESNGGDGRVHNTYSVFKKSEDVGGTFTGRSSASNPNVQNLDRKYKTFFSAPPGFVRVEADYSAVEFRGAAWCAREPTILAKYQENPLWDPHRAFAAVLYGCAESEITKDQRQVAKSADFSQLYVGTAGTLIHYAAKQGIELTWQQATYIHSVFHRVYNFRPWYQSVWEELKAYGYVETATGRRRHFGNVLTLSKEQRVDVLRQAVNMKVQPTFTADLSLLGLRACHTSGMPINYFCHDSIAFEFPADEWAGNREKLTEQIRWAMLEYPVQVLREKFGVNLDIPLEIEITVTKGVNAA